MTTVLHVITDPDRRGGQTFATQLAVALESEGFSSRVVALGNPSLAGDPLPVDVLGPTRRHATTVRALRRAMVAVDVTVAHGSTTLPMCVMAALGRRERLIYRQISDQRYWANTIRRRLQTRFALGRVRRVVALWRGAAAVLTDDFGVARRKVVVIPNAAPRDLMQPPAPEERARARELLGIPISDPVVAVVAALVPEKGVDSVIRAIAQPHMRKWWLLVVGAGPERAPLELLVQQTVPGRVRFVGSVRDVRAVLVAADAVALASQTENMPAVLIEAGLLGLPAVATAVGATSEVVIDDVTGRIVTVGDVEGLADALEDVHRRASAMGAAARAHCLEHFEMAPVAARWAAMLREVAAT